MTANVTNDNSFWLLSASYLVMLNDNAKLRAIREQALTVFSHVSLREEFSARIKNFLVRSSNVFKDELAE